MTTENRPFLLEVVNDTNMTVKYSKTCISLEHVWSFFEQKLFGDDNLEDIIEHGIRLLKVTVGIFYKIIEGDDTLPDEDEGDK